MPEMPAGQVTPDLRPADTTAPPPVPGRGADPNLPARPAPLPDDTGRFPAPGSTDDAGQGGPRAAVTGPQGPSPVLAGPAAAAPMLADPADPAATVASVPRQDPPEQPPPAMAGDQRAADRRGRRAYDQPGWYEPADRPPRGSPADLRRRLDMLPFGHPSSPYDDDGSRKAPPHSLRHLELPLPADDRDSEGSRPGPLSITGPGPGRSGREPIADLPVRPAAAGPADNGWRPSPDEAARRAETARQAVASRTQAAGADAIARIEATYSPAEPAAAEPAAAEPAAAEPAAAGPILSGSVVSSPLVSGSGHSPQPDHRTAYERGSPDTTRTGLAIRATAVQVSAADVLADSRPAAPAGAPGSLQPQAPRHVRPEAPRPVTPGPRPSRADEPQTTAGGAWEWRGARLTAEQARIAEQVYAQYQAAEGRNALGSYGRSGLTPAMRRIESQLEYGQLASDTERFALRDSNLFRHQFARLLARHPDQPPAELAYRIPDVIRYAYVLPPELYTEGTWEILRRLRVHGFELEERHNDWFSRDYQGIRTSWHDPAHNLPFGVQFHTAESLGSVLQGTKGGLAPPPGCQEIGDFRKEED
ncbi:MAG: hypothetical protein ACLQDY_30505 [Streptosporangiaceae bacterium]